MKLAVTFPLLLNIISKELRKLSGECIDSNDQEKDIIVIIGTIETKNKTSYFNDMQFSVCWFFSGIFKALFIVT